MEPKSIIRIWIVEDNNLYQKNLVSLIKEQNDMVCERIFSACESALDALRFAPSPDVILHDIGFDGMSGIASVKTMKKEHPEIQIIMVTVYDDGEHVFDALSAGATGYLTKTSSGEIIINSIREVLNGGSPMNSSIARMVIETFSKNKQPLHDYSLSLREKEILELIVHGHSNNVIAETLHLSSHTIDTHLRKIYEKLHVHTRTEAATKVLTERLL